MRIIEVVPTIESLASGPAYSVPRLASALADRGHVVDLMTVGAGQIEASSRARHRSFKRDWDLPFLRSLFASSEMIDALRIAVTGADIIHSNGLWVMPALYPGHAAKRAGIPLVLSPRGTLSPVALKISPLRKKIFWNLMQARIAHSAACLHATSEQEYLDFRRFGLQQPIAIVPNGIDFQSVRISAESPGTARRRLLYLGRIHPIKGLEVLLEAWSHVQSHHADWELKLIGPDERAHTAHLQKIVIDKKLERVLFAGACYGREKDDEMAAADLYVLPSFSENFGMSVAESLSHAVPVVTTTGTPWAGLTDKAAGWCVAPGTADPLAAALEEAMAKRPEDLKQMGANGKAWMERDFSWKSIAKKMEAVYSWLIGGGTPPDTVRLN